jgi:hypothetical protein
MPETIFISVGLLASRSSIEAMMTMSWREWVEVESIGVVDATFFPNVLVSLEMIALSGVFGKMK